ncbi:MAG TPA: SdpI family protein [Coriobacteriia bacterium]
MVSEMQAAPGEGAPQPDELPAPPRIADFTKLPLLIIAVMFIAGAVLYPSMPMRFPTHWGVSGGPDAWSTRSFLSVFLMPLTAAGIYALLVFAPFLDPRRRNLKMSLRAYNILIDAVVGMQAVVFAATTAAAFNAAFDVTKIILVSVGLLFAVVGNFMTTVKQNWTFGVRVSWTLSDEVVWRKTNRLGGYLFVGAGVVTVLAAFLPATIGLAVMLSAITVMLVVTYGYSYLLYRSRHPEA